MPAAGEKIFEVPPAPQVLDPPKNLPLLQASKLSKTNGRSDDALGDQKVGIHFACWRVVVVRGGGPPNCRRWA